MDFNENFTEDEDLVHGTWIFTLLFLKVRITEEKQLLILYLLDLFAPNLVQT